MARVTVEDCIENIPNRFELVGIAARRAKQISSGSPITIDRDNDKDAVVSLREIADKTVEFEPLKEEIIEGYSRFQRPDVIDGVALPPEPEQIAAEVEAMEEGEEGFSGEEMDLAADMEEDDVDEEAAMLGEAPEGMAFDDEIDADD